MRNALLALPLLAALATPAAAREYFIGGPLHTHDMEIVANYLVGVEMSPMMPGMAHGPDVIHIEADVHATADNIYGFPDGAWVGYLTIAYKLEKLGSPWKTEGKLHAMQAKDGPHYADNVKMDGPGKYKLTYDFSPPKPTATCATPTRKPASPTGGSPSPRASNSNTPRSSP